MKKKENMALKCTKPLVTLRGLTRLIDGLTSKALCTHRSLAILVNSATETLLRNRGGKNAPFFCTVCQHLGLKRGRISACTN